MKKKHDKYKFSTDISIYDDRYWSFGLAICHTRKDCMLHINLFKLHIGIGVTKEKNR